MFKSIAVTTGILIALVAFGYFLVSGIGKSISSDLSVIGKGKPVLVLAYENYSLNGGEALNRLSKIRSDYDSRLDFVVADMGTPEGHMFTSRYKLFDGQALLLKQDGRPLSVIGIPSEEKELRRLLETKLVVLEGNK